MKKIYNDESRIIKEWSTKKLKAEARTYYDLIYGEYPCYGTRDLIAYNEIMDTLASRRVTVSLSLEF